MEAWKACNGTTRPRFSSDQTSAVSTQALQSAARCDVIPPNGISRIDGCVFIELTTPWSFTFRFLRAGRFVVQSRFAITPGFIPSSWLLLFKWESTTTRKPRNYSAWMLGEWSARHRSRLGIAETGMHKRTEIWNLSASVDSARPFIGSEFYKPVTGNVNSA